MQFNLAPAFFIFLGSYFPLAIILAIQDIPLTWWKQSICRFSALRAAECVFIPFEHAALSLVFLVVSGLAVFLARYSLNHLNYPFRAEIKRSKAIPSEIINYTFPYVVSFMGMTYSEPQKMLGFFVFLIWMFAITYKSGQILMNPLLLIFGWRLHEATIVISSEEKDVRVLRNSNQSPKGAVEVQTIQDFYIIKG